MANLTELLSKIPKLFFPKINFSFFVVVATSLFLAFVNSNPIIRSLLPFPFISLVSRALGNHVFLESSLLRLLTRKPAMDITGTSRIRHNQTTSSERFLGAYSHAPPDSNADASTSSVPGDELHEDDIFWNGESAAESPRHDGNGHNHHVPSSPSSSSASASRVNNHNNRIVHPKGGFAQPEGFGILAALPENETSSPNLREFSHFFHKASVSSSCSSSPSSSRLIPVIPKPPQDRITPISSVKYHQSAPVNVPMLSEPMRRPRNFFAEVDADDDDDGDAEMLPPHEIVARSLAQAPMLSCSVLEGAGRTLKGRDLRQVRNAVFRQTGFLD